MNRLGICVVLAGALTVLGRSDPAGAEDGVPELAVVTISDREPAGAEAPGPSPVVFGRALDLEGTPMRLVRTTLPGGKSAVIGSAGYRGPFARPRGMPLRAYAISSSFGMRYHPLLGGQRFHAGLDFPAPAGTPVQATAPGAVSFAGWYGGYGLCVAIDHGNGYMTLFAHLSALSINQGTVVSAGSALGRVGSTGQSTGPHLHYEVRYNGRPVDPRGFL